MSKPARELKGRAARLAQLLPSGRNKAARTPFVLLVVLLLGGGLIGLLVLNSALNAGSFQLSRYEKRNTELTDEEQALQRDIDDRSAPGALAKRARELGMVPGGGPVFLDPDGTVHGVPAKATALPAAAQAPPAPPEPATTPEPLTTPGPSMTSELSFPAGVPPSGAAASAFAIPAPTAAVPAPFAEAPATAAPIPTPGR
ncbi:hypothetical protein [Streptomyces sp. NBC_00344]|uniref:hypothetical protein n=1 Tax=Streptomyces sp. NBC_00344 TaxID=2975720 RepID=UPI002E1D070E